MNLAIDFPPISHAVEWPIIFGGDVLGVNKVVLLMWLSVIVVFAFFFVASRKQELIPAGVQNVAESTVDFIRNGIILQTMGEEGLFYTPFLLMMFSFIFVCNIWEVIPVAQMPVNARIALPMFMALLVYVMYHFVGIKGQGLGGYLKSSLVPPGVPKAILPLLVFIELITMLITKPLSLCVRLFANMFAGHLLLITFSIISATLFAIQWQIVILPFSAFLLIALTGFEVLVAFLQAFIFTILTAVYIGQSMHPEH
ncbi:MAG TPA: F0F1 ATP synthase subunit A [Acidimicrobiales bacterium]|nr:F0F1 ATP synthase subunit A [Acidimicrobiales bacterium]